MAIRFKLNEFLTEQKITPYKVSKVSGLSLTTVYGINRDKTKRIDKVTLDALLVALEDLTGKHLEVSDIVAFERD